MDARKFIPQTDQTDVNKFPPYEYRPYPKMMNRDHPDKKRADKGARVPYEADGIDVEMGYAAQPGDPVVVKSEEEQEEFLSRHPEAPAQVHVDPKDAEIARLRAKAGEPIDEPRPAKRKKH